MRRREDEYRFTSKCLVLFTVIIFQLKGQHSRIRFSVNCFHTVHTLRKCQSVQISLDPQLLPYSVVFSEILLVSCDQPKE